MVGEKELAISTISSQEIMGPRIAAMTGVILAVSAFSLYGLLHPIFALRIRGRARLCFA